MANEKTEQPGAATEAASNDDRSQLLADLATEDRGAAQASSVIPEDAEHAASGAEDGVVAEEGQSGDVVVDPKAVDSKAEDAPPAKPAEPTYHPLGGCGRKDAQTE